MIKKTIKKTIELIRRLLPKTMAITAKLIHRLSPLFLIGYGVYLISAPWSYVTVGSLVWLDIVMGKIIDARNS